MGGQPYSSNAPVETGTLSVPAAIFQTGRAGDIEYMFYNRPQKTPFGTMFGSTLPKPPFTSPVSGDSMSKSTDKKCSRILISSRKPAERIRR